jgi:DMSO/TMAO reductase YedYZ heme-binding membrane subunit
MTSEAAPNTSTTQSGWGLTLRIALVLTVASIALFVGSGVSEDSVRAWIRATARASVALFLLTFIARPLRQFVKNDATRWLLANRRYLGVSGAYAQLLHGISLVWLFSNFASYEPDLVGLIGGGLGFALYFAMALTSSDAAKAALGARAWNALHTAGAYWIWLIFAVTNWGNVPLAFQKLDLAHQVLYAGLQATLFSALVLRAAASLSARARVRGSR